MRVEVVAAAALPLVAELHRSAGYTYLVICLCLSLILLNLKTFLHVSPFVSPDTPLSAWWWLGSADAECRDDQKF